MFQFNRTTNYIHSLDFFKKSPDHLLNPQQNLANVHIQFRELTNFHPRLSDETPCNLEAFSDLANHIM